ncbi:MAG: plastocyanin/azurin family copper-binding protein [Halobacteriales archaeon]
MERRSFLRYAGFAGTAGATGITGCLDGGNDGNETDGNDTDDADGNETSDEGPSDHVEVTAGPDGAWEFEPEEVEVAVGGTVEWYFASGGHNVTSHPDAHNKCENPEGAEPFKSYEGDDHMSVNDVDSTFSHTFETPGEYTYVCTPHATQMVGYVTVVEV